MVKPFRKNGSSSSLLVLNLTRVIVDEILSFGYTDSNQYMELYNVTVFDSPSNVQ